MTRAKPVPITGSVLRWARGESGFSEDEFAERLGVDVDAVHSWESGDASPTKGQFSKIVDVLHRPSALFFLKEPPTTAAVPTSLRAAPGLRTHELKPSELRQIRWARRLQHAVSWALRDEGSGPVELGRYDPRSSPEDAAIAERERVEVPVSDQLAWPNLSVALRTWRSALEDLGLLVFQLEMGRNNIRGFSGLDAHAPLVAVNSAYHPSNRIFTLFHELGHLVTNTESACIGWVRPGERDSAIERWCERFAASLLLPASDVELFARSVGLSGSELARRTAARFKVSARASAVRLQELDLAPSSLYAQIEDELAQLDWNPKGGGGKGVTTAEKRLRQLGGRTPEILFEAETGGSFTLRDVADYLNATTDQVDDLQSLIARRVAIDDE